MTELSAHTAAASFDARHGNVTLSVAALAALAIYLDTTILFVAFPDITASFDQSSASALSWVLNAYTIVFAALLVPAGKLADRFGHRRAFLVGSDTLRCCMALSNTTRLGGRALRPWSCSPRGWSILKAGLGVAPGPLIAAVLAPRFGKLAGQIGQRPLVILGGIFGAASGLYRIVFPTEEIDYLVDLAVSAVAIGLVFPQVTSVAVQALPANRVGVGGAVTQAVRQFGGSFGVALTIARLGTASGIDDFLAGFDRIWWPLVTGGLMTTFFALPLRTRVAEAERQ